MEKLSLRQKIAGRLDRMVVRFHRMRGCEIGTNCHISRRAVIDRANPKGVHIGNNTRILLEAMVIAHNYSRGALEGHSMWLDTYIGDNCVIGGRSMILPGVHLGNHVYVGGGSVVTKSFPDHCLIAGNPARIVRRGTVISDAGQIVDSGEKVSK